MNRRNLIKTTGAALAASILPAFGQEFSPKNGDEIWEYFKTKKSRFLLVHGDYTEHPQWFIPNENKPFSSLGFPIGYMVNSKKHNRSGYVKRMNEQETLYFVNSYPCMFDEKPELFKEDTFDYIFIHKENEHLLKNVNKSLNCKIIYLS